MIIPTHLNAEYASCFYYLDHTLFGPGPFP